MSNPENESAPATTPDNKPAVTSTSSDTPATSAAPTPAADAPKTDATAPTEGSDTPKILEDLDAEKSLEERVIAVLRTVFDPEIPVNIYDLGLIYSVDANEESGLVKVTMTLTSPACPVAGTLPGDVEIRIKELQDVTDAEVELVWDPPWDKECLSDAAKLTLGLM